MKLLEVKNWKVNILSKQEKKKVVKNLTFFVETGEILGLVGESGSGKSVSMLSLMGLLETDRVELSGSVIFDGREYNGRDVPKGIAMIFQNSFTCLNPTMTIGKQILETVMLHTGCQKQVAKERTIELLEQVGINHPELRLEQYPFELSGGMRQRVVIAIALACEPKLIIADEPTTALDVTVQAGILELMKRIAVDTGVSILLISHDLGVVASLCKRVLIMNEGTIIESGSVEDIFYHPEQKYTKQLLGHKCKRLQSQEKNEKKSTLLQVQNISKHYSTKVLDRISFTIQKGESFGLVGESGSGKTTLARMMMGIGSPDCGHILYEGTALDTLNHRQWKPYRKKIQMIFQDPYASLNPRMTVEQIVKEPLIIHRLYDADTRNEKVKSMLAAVGLKQEYLSRYPKECSGGERQRIGIARALIVEPELLVCDEPTSALDIAIREQIMELLGTLQKKKSLSFLLIAHDIELIKNYSDRVGIMYLGDLVEMGKTKEICEDPWHPYTKALLSAAPIADPKLARRRTRILLQGEEREGVQEQECCLFCKQCRYALEECFWEKPGTYSYGERSISCHLYSEKRLKGRDKKYRMASQI
ncbi:dipeptide ABC transporter ATP-binding protein [Lachnospiraceae bacterium LCP25S3_G4]